MRDFDELLNQTVVAGYQRFFRAAALLYPPILLYFAHWVPTERLAGFLVLRVLLAAPLYRLARNPGSISILILRFAALLYIMLAMIANLQLAGWGGPALLDALAHGGLLLFGNLEVQSGWTLVMSGLLSLAWHFLDRFSGGEGDFGSSGLAFSLAISLFVVVTRGSSLRRKVHLSVEQDQINTRLGAALDMLDGCNAELEIRVAERRAELERTCQQLEQAHARLEVSHQEENRLQAEWLQAQRLEMLGRFATGLSHSFSNTVSSIWLGIHQLEGASRAANFSDCLADVEKACETLSGICRRLLMVGGGQTIVEQTFEVNQQVLESLALLRRSVPNPLHFTTNTDKVYAHGDPALLEQIVMNLIINASGASLEDQPISGEVDGRAGCSVHVIDKGIGMDAQVLEKIFEPFYTTKGDGKGQGLGLAIVSGAIERLRGRCSVSSLPGQGTEIVVNLPVVSDSFIPGPESKPKTEEAPAAPLRVCLVEDQDALRKLLANYLLRQGHAVNAFASAEEACLADNSYDLLVTDISLPGRNGVDLARQLALRDPKLRVILMSGYPFEAESVRMDSRRWVFLPKPFRLSEFGQQFVAAQTQD